MEAIRSYGLYVEPCFMDATMAQHLIDSFKDAHAEQGAVGTQTEVAVNTSIRRAKCCNLPAGALGEAVDEALRQLLPALSTHFHTELRHYEEPQILRYGRGDFYRPHVDTGLSKLQSSDHMPRRKVSVVIFLNEAGRFASEGQFVGGALAFYLMSPGATEEDCKQLLSPTTGLLVAFRSTLWHEVMPVSAGDRFSLVTWCS